MPIINIQRRMAEQGRIRLGQKVATSSGKTRPDKLDRFRFTSPNQGLIEQIAARYGGEPQPWDNAGKAEHEVITDARSIPVIVVKGGFSQWYELWSKAGCQHRCDGEKDPAGNYCDPDDPAHLEATEKPTTRLSVMLSEIETLGVWRMESKGWNAAAELPSMAELAMHVGDLVPATLSLAERSAVIDGPRGPQTSRFVVPVLDLHITKARLVELVGGQGGQPALEQASQQRAIEHQQQPQSEQRREVDDDVVDAIADCRTAEEARVLWNELKARGALTEAIAARITAHVAELKADEQQPAPAPQAAASEGDPGWVTDDAPAAQQGDVDALWQEAVAQAGRLGWSLAALQGEFEGYHAVPVADATAEQMAAFVHALKTGEIGQQAVSA